MMTLWRNYGALLRHSMAIQLQYRASVFIWSIGGIIQPLILTTVFTRIAQEQGGAIGAFSTGDLAAYYIVAMFVDRFTFTWIMWEYDFRIRNGQMNQLLMLPIHPIHRDIADNLTYKLIQLLFFIPATVLLVFTFRPIFNTTVRDVLIFVPALLLSFFIRFLSGWCLAISAFWLNRTEALSNSYFVVRYFFSGQLLPIELLPVWMATLSVWLPFRWHYAFPVELFLGRLNSAEIMQGFAFQLCWLAAIGLLTRTLWRRGVKQYGAFGS